MLFMEISQTLQAPQALDLDTCYYVANSCEMGISDLPDMGMSAMLHHAWIEVLANYYN